MLIKIKKENENAKIPTRGTQYSAGYDLYACIPEYLVINPHQTVKVGTGISCELPENTFGAIFARSGLATKEGLRPANCVGVIDSDYRGEIIVALHNDSEETRVVDNGERIAQLVLMPFIPMEFEEVKELSETKRSSSGFGSTGM